jgi:hypothetical protein
MMIVICRSYMCLRRTRGSRNQLQRILQTYLFNEMQHAGGDLPFCVRIQCHAVKFLKNYLEILHLFFLYVWLQFVNPGGLPEQICRGHGQLLHDGFDK